MIFRQANFADIASLSKFFADAWKEAGPGALGFSGATDESMKEISSRVFLESLLARPKTWIFIAEEKGTIAGFASLKSVAGEVAELSGIIVLERATGSGIGTGLLQIAKEHAAKSGFSKMVAKTELFNQRAIAFYLKNGFSETARVTEIVDEKNLDLVILETRIR